MLIAQITDAHFGAPGETVWGGYEASAPMAAVVARLKALEPRPDLVLFTGDLTENPVPAAYAQAGEALAALGLPMAAIPGNHDDRALFRQTFTGLGARVGHGEYLQLALDAGPARLLMLDTLDPGRAPGGALTEDRLEWLEARLDEARARPTLIAMHHPPVAIGIEGMDVIRCANGERMAAILGRNRQVRRVLCGHVHRAVHADWAGTQLSISPAIAWQIGLGYRPGDENPHKRSAPGFQLHRIQPGGSVLTHTVFLA